MRTLSYVIPFSNLNLFVQFLSLRVSSNFQTQHSVHTIIHTTYSNIHTIPLCLTLCGILCLRENPDCKSHANTEGKGWKKAPPGTWGTCFTEHWGTPKHTGAAVGGVAMSGTRGWGTPDLSYHLYFLSIWHLCITECHCEMWEGWENENRFLKNNRKQSMNNAFRKHSIHNRLVLHVNVCVSDWKWKRNENRRKGKQKRK